VQVELAAQRVAAKTHRVAPDQVAGELLLQDRAYADPLYVDEVRQGGGFCVIRATQRINPKVLRGQVGSVPWEPRHGKKFKEVLTQAQGQHVDLQVEFPKSARRTRSVRLRVVALWNPVTRQHVLLLTNLDPEPFPAALVGELYRLRWRVAVQRVEVVCEPACIQDPQRGHCGRVEVGVARRRLPQTLLRTRHRRSLSRSQSLNATHGESPGDASAGTAEVAGDAGATAAGVAGDVFLSAPVRSTCESEARCAPRAGTPRLGAGRTTARKNRWHITFGIGLGCLGSLEPV
jgi:hypothetical protein